MIYIPVTPGELADRIVALEIATEKAGNKEELRQLNKQLDPLLVIFQDEFPWKPGADLLMQELREVHRTIRDTQEAIASYIRAEQYGEVFIHLVKSLEVHEAKRQKTLRKIDKIHKV